MEEIAEGRTTRALVVDQRSSRPSRHLATPGAAAPPAPLPHAGPTGGSNRMAWCAGLLGAGLLGAAVGAHLANPAPSAPIVAGRYLTEPALTAPNPPVLTTGLLEQRDVPATAADPAPVPALPEPRPARAMITPWPPPSPPKPRFEIRRVWVPEPKPTRVPRAEGAVTTVWPSPPKPTHTATVWPSPPRTRVAAIAPAPPKPVRAARHAASVTPSGAVVVTLPERSSPSRTIAGTPGRTHAAVVVPPAPPKPDVVAAAPSMPSVTGLSADATAPGNDGLDVAPAAPPEPSRTPPVRVDRGPGPADIGTGGSVAVADRATSHRALERAAREAIRAERSEEALALYEQLVALSPQDRNAWLGRAAALWQLGRRREAVAAYRTILEADPGDVSAKIALLGLIAEDAPDEALRQLIRLASEHPKNGRIPARAASILAGRNQLPEAVAQLRRAVSLEPSNATYWANLGILLDRAGRIDDAIAHYRTALRLAADTGAPNLRVDAIATRVEHLSTRRRG